MPPGWVAQHVSADSTSRRHLVSRPGRVYSTSVVAASLLTPLDVAPAFPEAIPPTLYGRLSVEARRHVMNRGEGSHAEVAGHQSPRNDPAADRVPRSGLSPARVRVRRTTAVRSVMNRTG